MKRDKYGRNTAYSEDILNKINELALKGVTDKEIAKELSLSTPGISRYTTLFWNTRMAEAQLRNIDVIDAKIITPDGKEILI